MSIRNATASWSGYSHQGHVGILVALRKIIHLGIDNVELGNHHLEYETREDVAIFYNATTIAANNHYHSVHQVKAYYSDGHLKSKYSSVLNEPFQMGDENYLHTVLDIGDWGTSATTNINNVSRYEYSPNTFFCGIDDMQDYIINELRKLIGDNQGRCQSAYHRLIFELDSKIRDEHRIHNKATYNIVFTLDEILEIVQSESEFICSNIYYSRKSFYEEFQNIIKNIEIAIDADHLSYISTNVVEAIYKLDDNDFLDFSKKLNFNKTVNQLNLPHYNFNPDGLKQLFYKLLMDIVTTQPIIQDNLVKYIKVGTVNPHILTSIIDEEDNKKEMVKNIINNLSSNNLLWEKHIIINKDVEGTLSDLNPSIFSTSTSKEFMKYADTKIINRTNAKQHLNE